MKVLRVLHSLNIGGIQRQFLALLPHLLGEMEIHVCVLERGGTLEEKFRALDVPVHYVPLGWKYNPWGMARLSRFITVGGYDLVHVHKMEGLVFPVVVASLAAGVPVVVQHHFLYRWLSGRKRFLESWATKRAQGVVAVSHPVKEHSCRELGIEAQRVTVVYNGISLDTPVPRKFSPWTVGMVARMVRHKRVDVFLKGAVRTASILEPVVFRVVGGGEREARYRKMARDLGLEGKVTFTGFSKEVEREMASFTLGALPSENEGFPNTLLEYGTLGLPVVVSSIPQNREVVEDGREGLIVPVGDAQALAMAQLYLLLNRANSRKAGFMARRRAARFSLDRTADSLRGFYAPLLEERVPSTYP